jgi:hypothetical protein
MGPKQRRLPHDVGLRHASRELTLHRLGDDEADVMCEAVIEPLASMRGGVRVAERGLHSDLSVAHLDREGRRVVRPEIESAAAFEVEAGVVPMTGRDLSNGWRVDRKPSNGGGRCLQRPFNVDRVLAQGSADGVHYHKRTIGLRPQRLSRGIEAVLRAE